MKLISIGATSDGIEVAASMYRGMQEPLTQTGEDDGSGNQRASKRDGEESGGVLDSMEQWLFQNQGQREPVTRVIVSV